MNDERWVTKKEFMKINHCSFDAVNYLIMTNQVETKLFSEDSLRIKIGGNTVPFETYKNVVEECARLREKLNNVKLLLEV